MYRQSVKALLLVLLILMSVSSGVLAEGTETLGPPAIPVSTGSGIVAAGIGLETQPGTLEINVPGTVQQAILYWSGGARAEGDPGDSTITVNGTNVTGTLIGGPTFFFNRRHFSAYRADITALNLVTPGANSLIVEGMDFGTDENNGAGLLVIYDDGLSQSDIQLRDGIDLAFFNFPEPRTTTIPQEFTFAPVAVERTSDLALFFGSASIEGLRPSSIEVTVAGVTTLHSNLVGSNDGEQWDTITLSIVIPAGADSLTVQPFSRNDFGSNQDPLAASFTWIGAALSVPLPAPASLGDRVWEDVNGNGIQDDGEPGVPNVPVRLLTPGDDGVCNTGDEVEIANTTTDASGNYGFGDLAPGDYCVHFSNPAGTTFTTQNQGGDPAKDSDVDPATGQTSNITLVSGQNDPTWDAGLIEPGVCAVTLDKKCMVVVDASENEPCETQIAATRLRYTGPDILGATVVFTGKFQGSATYEDVDLISGQTVLATQNGFTIDARPGSLGPQLTITINGIAEAIHTSCSQPYVVGQPAPLDSPSAGPSPTWLVESFIDKEGNSSSLPVTQEFTNSCSVFLTTTPDGQLQGSTVKYQYEVTNNGDALTGLLVQDDLLGDIAGPIDLASGATMLFEKSTQINSTTTNVGSVFGTLANDASCQATDSVTVTAQESCAVCKGGVSTISVRYQGTAPATVVIYDHGKVNASKILFGPQEVQPDQLINLVSRAGADKLHKEISIYVDGTLNTLLHTDCSQPLLPGTVSGLFEVTEARTKSNELICSVGAGTTASQQDVFRIIFLPAVVR